jgi:hypothetical protein
VFLRQSDRLPVDVCQEFVKTQRLGMLDPTGNCTPGMNLSNTGSGGDKAIGIIRQLLGMVDGIVVPSNLCGNLNPSYSYFRVPVPVSKSGGGIRVKRLLMFDQSTGLDSGPVLYGNEYQYKTIRDGKVISSGVATNEPQTIREENVLVDFVARKDQSLWSRIISGKDKKQAEGPIGESVLPGPSVGYSKVIVTNIHSGKTNPGYSVSDYYTAKDYPIQLAKPSLPETMTAIYAADPLNVYFPGILVNVVQEKTWHTQGFSFVLNSMHGQIKNKFSYNGPISDVLSNRKSSIISGVSYEFFNPGEKVPTVSSLFGEVKLKNPGREVDLAFAQKAVEEKSYDANIEGDLELAIIPFFIPLIFIYPTAMPAINFTEGSIYTHASSKTVRYPAILKSTKVYQDGIIHTEENVGFDEYTGKPVVVKSLDEFNGAYLASNIPASWEYASQQSMATNQGLAILPSQISNPFTYSSSPTDQLSFANDGCAVLSKIVTGDVLELGTDALFQVKSIDYTRDKVDLVRVAPFVGIPPTSVSKITIVKSGKTNKLNEQAGDLTVHDPNSDNLSIMTNRLPESQRYISSGTNADDGSLFVNDLNAAFDNQANPDYLLLPGPYRNMNLIQFSPQLPAGCSADLQKAEVKEVTVNVKNVNGALSIQLGTFYIKCADNNWVLVKMPNN